MNQTWENGKKSNLGPNFGLFGPHLHPKTFFRIQFQEKLMIQTQENDEKAHFGPDVGPLAPLS